MCTRPNLWEFENDCLLGCSAMQSGRHLPEFQRFHRAVSALLAEVASSSEMFVNFYQTMWHTTQKTAFLIFAAMRITNSKICYISPV